MKETVERFDGDIVFSTDNPIIVNNVVKGILPISYEKVSVPKKKFSQEQIIKADLRGFNSKIGPITNNSSCMFAMLPVFRGDKERENIIKERIRILRKLIGNAIDAAKGVEYIPFPSDWKKELKIEEGDTEEQKAFKRRRNSMRIKKKPYYFIYIYDKLKKQYTQYKKNNDYICQIKFGCKLRDLIAKENKSDAEIRFLSSYNYHSPVLETNCIMNMLCKRVEDLDFNLKYDKKGDPNFDYTIYIKEKPCNEVIYKQAEEYMKAMSRSYNGIAARLREDGDEAKKYGSTLAVGCKMSLDLLFNDCYSKLMTLVNNRSFMADYVVDIAYKKGSPGLFKTFAWTMFGKDIVKKVGEKKDTILVPIITEENENSTNIFGTNVELKEIRKEQVGKTDENEDEMFSVFEDLIDGDIE